MQDSYLLRIEFQAAPQVIAETLCCFLRVWLTRVLWVLRVAGCPVDARRWHVGVAATRVAGRSERVIESGERRRLLKGRFESNRSRLQVDTSTSTTPAGPKHTCTSFHYARSKCAQKTNIHATSRGTDRNSKHHVEWRSEEGDEQATRRVAAASSRQRRRTRREKQTTHKNECGRGETRDRSLRRTRQHRVHTFESLACAAPIRIDEMCSSRIVSSRRAPSLICAKQTTRNSQQQHSCWSESESKRGKVVLRACLCELGDGVNAALGQDRAISERHILSMQHPPDT